eukprot:gnl/TRDRNA2_/TRDRNA2_168040_c1_seq3.p1 gnl/TRDRNA2_/TRDRNA2_168040_c1~~gnl/TRDRNA2_/TRDRNA2_168040_c1_seq3.p1  ORF type:complete len:125 (+),score=23.35 gnl/TRDRNA2_/TRDRNA2_168040_c1_seq3:172-546(+)
MVRDRTFNLSAVDLASGRTALAVAAASNDSLLARQVVHLLLEWNAPVDLADDGGRTALSLAAEQGHAEVVTLLWRSGASAKKVDNDQRSPIDYAVAKRDKKVALALGVSKYQLAQLFGVMYSEL